MTLNDLELTRRCIEAKSLIGQVANHMRAGDTAKMDEALKALRRVVAMARLRRREMKCESR